MIYYWFDCFTVNQHRSGERDFAWWRTTFREAVKGIGHTALVLHPWQAPKPLTRAWCLWEVCMHVLTLLEL